MGLSVDWEGKPPETVRNLRQLLSESFMVFITVFLYTFIKSLSWGRGWLQGVGSTGVEVGEGEGLQGPVDEVGSTRWALGIMFARSWRNTFMESLSWGRGGLQ